jgi:PmbA protein
MTFQEQFRSIPFPPGVETEVMVVESQRRTVGWADGKPHLQQYSNTTGLCVRVISDGGQGVVTRTAADVNDMSSLISQAALIASMTAKDSYRRLADPAPASPSSLEIDETLFSHSIDSLSDSLSAMEKNILAHSSYIKRVIRLQIQESREKKTLVNSRGVSLSSTATTAAIVGEVLAEKEGESEVAWDAQENRFFKKLSFEDFSASLADDAVRSLGGRPLPSGPIPVVIHPRVGAQLLSLLSSALSAEAVQMGRSFLRNCKGEIVAGSLVNLMDDPFLPEGIASESFDDEGTPHQKIDVIKNGRLENYYYDLRSAAKEGLGSNGFGMKEGIESLPHPQATNLYMAPGTTTVSDMLASASQVFYVHEVMGLHMADLVTGEFSLGASGYLYENGKYERPVRGVTIAGELKTIFKNIKAVGSNLTWKGSFGAPSFLISHLTIAGA